MLEAKEEKHQQAKSERVGKKGLASKIGGGLADAVTQTLPKVDTHPPGHSSASPPSRFVKFFD